MNAIHGGLLLLACFAGPTATAAPVWAELNDEQQASLISLERQWDFMEEARGDNTIAGLARFQQRRQLSQEGRSVLARQFQSLDDDRK